MKGARENRKGISVLVSNALMLIAVVVASSIVFAYVNLYVNDYQVRGGAALKERLLIEDVWYRNDGTIITVYNYGKIDSKIVRIYIDGGLGKSPYETIEAGDSFSFEVDVVDVVTDPGELHNIKLLTERGYSLEGKY